MPVCSPQWLLHQGWHRTGSLRRCLSYHYWLEREREREIRLNYSCVYGKPYNSIKKCVCVCLTGEDLGGPVYNRWSLQGRFEGFLGGGPGGTQGGLFSGNLNTQRGQTYYVSI